MITRRTGWDFTKGDSSRNHGDWRGCLTVGIESQSSKRSELVDVFGWAEGHALLQSGNFGCLSPVDSIKRQVSPPVSWRAYYITKVSKRQIVFPEIPRYGQPQGFALAEMDILMEME
jgi:hypothetical protein